MGLEMIKKLVHPHLTLSLALSLVGLAVVLSVYAVSANQKTAAFAGSAINFSIFKTGHKQLASSNEAMKLSFIVPTKPSSLQGVSNIGSAANLQTAIASTPKVK